MFGFEKLEVWNLSADYARMIYHSTADFPRDERFGLTNQIRRSAVSISANIAEGSGRTSSRDFSRFVEIAFGSLMETVSHIRIARDQGFLPEKDYQELYLMAERLGKMLSGLRASLSKDVS